jgi:hypothetical protein
MLSVVFYKAMVHKFNVPYTIVKFLIANIVVAILGCETTKAFILSSA